MVSDADENVDALPVSETVKVKKAVWIEQAKGEEADVEFVLDTRNLAKRIAPSIPVTKAEKKGGKILLTAEIIQKVRRLLTSEREREKELRKEYPQLVIDADAGSASLNGARLDLNPPKEDIKRDAGLFVRYMDGYRRFHGDSAGMQHRYYEFANWFFCSPFMAAMRDAALRYDQKTLPYPVFGLLYGQSKAGKTSFLETLLKMMIGQRLKSGRQTSHEPRSTRFGTAFKALRSSLTTSRTRASTSMPSKQSRTTISVLSITLQTIPRSSSARTRT